MKKYYKNYVIPYYDTGTNNYLKPEMILSYMAETSTWHIDSLGLGNDTLDKYNYAWLLNRWEVDISDYPRAKEEVIVSTWTTGFNKFYAYREFIMKSSDNMELARASTIWILVDSITKKPKRIPTEMIHIFSTNNEKMVERKVDFKHYNDYLYSEEKNIYIRKSDIDNNNHVNNVKYLEWMLDSTDDDILNNHNIKSISIEYKKEVLYIDKPSVHSLFKVDNSEITSKYKITTENIDHAYGQIIWREIDVK
ncbi:hypothetical protein E4100_04085 [Soehngenia longivitae]|uniref:Acyl-ACP thioesterase n=1 Tax=Soehngenia longivitae TaxID=2562294 RepID=A0A4Z0D780_9FIRM|nr:acyl-ACP thioesterase domain-containing protein [Soehngenia longivitae]TFZ40743.1 hypothetical protein E4100_04085 [Soehngenia longivitae]